MFARRPRVMAANGDWMRRLAEAAGPDAPFDAIELRLSDPLITDYECANCGDTSGGAVCLNRRAAEFDDRITRCAACGLRGVRVQIRDGFTAGELAVRFGRAMPPVKYGLAAIGDEWICLDFEEDG
jgi:hypothetical protein